MESRWQLYTGMTGWEQCEQMLDDCLKAAFEALEARVAGGETCQQAANKAYDAMATVMCAEYAANYGAADSEPLHYMERAIKRYVKQRYGALIDL